MTIRRSDIAAGADWARRTLNKPERAVEVRTPEQRRADIRREVEAEVAQWDREREAQAERERGAQHFADTLHRTGAAPGRVH